MLKPIAVLFDLDGTLIDSLPDLLAALNEMLRDLDAAQLTGEEVRHMIGDGSRALVERALAATGANAELEAAHRKFLQVYEAAPAKLSRIYPGVAVTLKALRESGARLAVCTNKPQMATVAVLNSFDIATYFDVVLGGDVVPFRKPDPRHLLAAIDQLGSSPNECAMVGDNENDHAAARASGIPIILMRYGYLRVPPESVVPDAWLDDFAAIPAALATIFAS